MLKYYIFYNYVILGDIRSETVFFQCHLNSGEIILQSDNAKRAYKGAIIRKKGFVLLRFQLG